MPKFFSVRKAGVGIGAGMYGPAQSLSHCPGYRTDRHHPPPEDDTALFWDRTLVTVGVPKEQCRFGFGSIEQLKAWLYHYAWRQYLHERGFVIKVWDVADHRMHVGSAQAIAADYSLQRIPCEYLSLLDLESMDLPF